MARSHVAVAGTMALLLGMSLVLLAADPPKAKEQGKAPTPVAAPKKIAPTVKQSVTGSKNANFSMPIQPIELKTGEAAIEKALAEPTEFDFNETPLNKVVEQLRNRHHIEIQLDTKRLEQVDVNEDTPITSHIRGASLGASLHLALRKSGLAWAIRHDVLLITSNEEAEGVLTTRVYDVSDLVVFRTKDDDLWDNYDPLVDTLTTTVTPTSWESAGGNGAIAGNSLGTAKVLVISQTLENHKQIANVLAKIREIAKKTPDAELPRMDKPQVAPPPICLDRMPGTESLEKPTPGSQETQQTATPTEKRAKESAKTKK